MPLRSTVEFDGAAPGGTLIREAAGVPRRVVPTGEAPRAAQTLAMFLLSKLPSTFGFITPGLVSGGPLGRLRGE